MGSCNYSKKRWVKWSIGDQVALGTGTDTMVCTYIERVKATLKSILQSFNEVMFDGVERYVDQY